MPSRRPYRTILTAILLLPTLALGADETLTSAYDAILRGEFDAGKSVVAGLHNGGAQVKQVETWLDSYSKVAESRTELRQKTFEWNLDNAKKALDEGKTYLALSFATGASFYAPNRASFSCDPWVATLTEKARAEAQAFEKADKWARATAYYSALERLHEEDDQLRETREQAGRHARLEIVYDSKEALQRRTKDVNGDLLKTALKRINSDYFEQPDFRALADGALWNIEALCNTRKLYEYLDGVGNPEARNLFIKKLGELRAQVKREERYSHDDLKKLYSQIAFANKETVSLPEELLIVEFLEGALQELDDYSNMVWPADQAEFNKLMMGDFEGVGIQLGVDDRSGRLKVVTPLEDSPALEAGIRPGDLIISVNGGTTKGWTTEDAVRNIMGPSGSEVTLGLFRPTTGKELEFKLNRRRIILKTVRGVNRLDDGKGAAWNYMLDTDEGVAYIRLTGFHPESANELSDALKAAKAQGMKGLILDLRYNPGGLLDVAVEAVSTFVESGKVVTTSGRREQKERHDVTGRPEWQNLPLIVLINEGSASASEILAGALQDHERAVVLGERTFGKGSVQKVLPIGDKARLKLTTALYYLPSGRSPHKKPHADEWGVSPDVDVDLTPKEIRKVIEKQNALAVIRSGEAEAEKAAEEVDLSALKDDGKEKDKDDDEPLLSEADLKLLESDPFKAPDADPQLETALLQMRVKLTANLPWPARKLAAVKDDAKRQ
ncbi:putative CtpA-like serine protease [Phycisphaerae bacterium RAS1]|nr:putative CtpA-like serine protease [Phycisphaerae bacterium RAS1]